MGINRLKAEWPAPASVQAFTLTRAGGMSAAPFLSMNFATHVGDCPDHIQANRTHLYETLKLDFPHLKFQWLNQIHGCDVSVNPDCVQVKEADAIYFNEGNKVAVVQTADCVPIFLCSESGDEVALIHAGWRGLLGDVLGGMFGHVSSDVITNTMAKFSCPRNKILAHIGPAICSQHYWVGEDVKNNFIRKDPSHKKSFYPYKTAKSSEPQNLWHFNLYAVAKQILRSSGVHAIYGAHYCTFEQSSLFYSVRKKTITGRNAHLIWINEPS